MLKCCPICGALGGDLVFKFECSNSACQNYSPRTLGDVDEEVRLLLQSVWGVYGREESLDEFIYRFFSAGGTVERDPASPGMEDARIAAPDWLRQRMSAT